MADKFAVFVEGLTGLEDMAALRKSVRLEAVRALNTAAERGRTMGARAIRDEINFPAAYLSPGQKRLYVSKKATRTDLEARIRARARPTSLARFTTGATAINKAGVTVSVQPGKARFMKRAFLVRLKAGAGAIETRSNLGLAVRLKPGETLRNKNEVRRLDSNLYLLYGPSVDQVFRARDGSGVAEDISPEIADILEKEFLRLVELGRG
jgi:hypothetical protein